MSRELMMGDHALAAAALRAQCRFFAGYPITPQSEILEYLAAKMPETGGVFVQAESEWEAISMVFAAGAVGERAMTSSVGTAWTLMFEGLGHMVASEVPAVVVDVNRLGPGEGQLPPAQSDYKMATKGGHGDAHWVVLGPQSPQEMADHAVLAFDIADRYRNPVMILVDGMTAMSMESVELPDAVTDIPEKPWAATGEPGRPRNDVGPFLEVDEFEELNYTLKDKYDAMVRDEVRWEEFETADADIVVVAFGLTARTARQAVIDARAEGLRVGLLRPITLWPFPGPRIDELAATADTIVVAEMNMGQMVDDVRAAVTQATNIVHIGQPCWPILPDRILDELRRCAGSPAAAAAAPAG